MARTDNQTLSTDSLIGIGGIVISIGAAVFDLGWLPRLILAILAVWLIVYAARRHGSHPFVRIVASVSVIGLIIYFSWHQILEDFEKNHPAWRLRFEPLQKADRLDAFPTAKQIDDEFSKLPPLRQPDIPKQEQKTPQEPPNWLYSGVQQSTYGRVMFACFVPPIAATDQIEEIVRWQQQKQIFKSGIEAWGDTIGLDFSVSDIRGGLRITAEAKTDEAKRQMFRITGYTFQKIFMDVRRVGDWETVTFTVDWPEHMKPIVNMMTLPKDELEVFKKNTERIFNLPGKCQPI